jgi:hypothetical protein
MTHKTILILSKAFAVVIAFFLYSCAEEKIRCIEGDCTNGTGLLEQRWDNGEFTRYRGEFKDGKFVKGRMEFSNGTWLEGNFINNVLYGKGKAFTDDSSFYEGNFEGGSPNGFGIVKSKDGSIYEGAFDFGFRTGKGKLTYANGDFYEGDFHNNLFDGQGTFTWANTKVSYSGSWKGGFKDGQGKLTLANGDIREGVWAADTLVTQTNSPRPVDTGESLLKFTSYTKKIMAQSFMDEETIVYNETGSIGINEKKKTISIRYQDEIIQYPIIEQMEDGGDFYFYSIVSGFNGIGQYILRYSRSNNFFSVSVYDSYMFDFKQNGFKSTQNLVAQNIFELRN